MGPRGGEGGRTGLRTLLKTYSMSTKFWWEEGMRNRKVDILCIYLPNNSKNIWLPFFKKSQALISKADDA